MSEWLTDLRLRAKALFRRRQLDRDLDEELAFHLAMREQNEGASDATRKRFGNATAYKERCRELWTFVSIESLWADLRHAVRVLRHSPAFTSVAILSLALGIGANTAILNVARTVLYEPLPVKDPQRLVIASWSAQHAGRDLHQFNSSNDTDPKTGRRYSSNFSFRAFQALRQNAASSADVFAFIAAREANISVRGQPVVGAVLMASGNYFRGIGVSTVLGRPLVDADNAPTAAPAAVISHGFWVRAFGGDPAAIGTEIKVNGSPFTVVGVSPRGFIGVSNGGFFPPTDVTVPLSAQPTITPRWIPPGESMFEKENYLWLRLMARLSPGISMTRGQAALDTIFRQTIAASSEPALHAMQSPELWLFPGTRGLDSLRKSMERPLVILMAVGAIVLLIACVNLANLMLARGVAREKEMFVRLALGSGRLRLLRQMMAESFLLALSGGALGIILALWGGRALVAMLTPATGTAAVDLSLNWPLLGLAAASSIFTGMLFGLFPALRTVAADLAPMLNRVRLGNRAPRLGASRVLVVLQVGFSMLLLVGAALFLRTLYNLGNVALGFNPRGLILFKVDPTLNGYKGDKTAFYYRELLRRVEAVPGITSATLMDMALITGWVNSGPVSVDHGERKYIHWNGVAPRFFETLGIEIVAGRGIGLQDTETAPKVVVLNQSAARELFGSASPLGRIIRRSTGRTEYDMQVVGIAKDSKYDEVRKPAPPTMFMPYLQEPGGPGSMHVALRTAADPAGVMKAVRAAVAEVDRNIPIVDLKTQTEQIDEALGKERLFSRLLVFFGMFALLLACIGLHGLTSYAVERRTGEIGIRMALGAGRSDVLWMVLRQVVVLAGAGLAIGIPASLAATRLVRALLFGLEPGDPLALAAAALVMAAVAMLAGYIPARRASRMDPLAALRYE
jgi:predicted permease